MPPGGEWEVQAEAPAKLNLGLAVMGPRGDGFHDLLTVFQAIDLCDALYFRNRAEGGVHLEVDGTDAIPRGAQNLVVRAAELLAAARGITRGVEVRLEKRIPAGAGLGGGSSDAAATLLALEQLWGLSPDLPERRRLALALGSDVPFFLVGGTARGEGRGEVLTPLTNRLAAQWLLVLPPWFVSTAEAFRRLDPGLTPSGAQLRIVEDAILHGDLEAFAAHLVNDLEPGVVRMEPRLARIRESLLRRGARAVGLTGSGSAMFALFGSQGELASVLEAGADLFGARLVPCRPVGSGARVVTYRHDDHRGPDHARS